jgi:hypothetical protein
MNSEFPMVRQDRPVRADLWLLLVALLGGALFFTSLDRLWPLADTDVNMASTALIADAREFLISQGIPAERHLAASRLQVDGRILDYLLRSFGHDYTQRLIREGKAVYFYEIYFKEGDNPDSAWVALHPEAGVVGWGRTVQEDAAGAVVEPDLARATAADLVTAALGLRLGDLEESGQFLRARPARRDHVFVYEHHLSHEPELRERVTVTIAGDELIGVQRILVLPESARRDSRRRQAPMIALQMAGILLVGIAALGALVVFLTRLQRGQVRLRAAALWVGIIAVFFLVTQTLDSASLLVRWDPLWPRWVAALQSLGFSLGQGAWIAFGIFIVIAAGDALDREMNARRGESLWKAGRGMILDPTVGMASLRGFLVGLVCGGALVGTLLLLERFAGAWMAIQPQGFFFFAINSSVPTVSILLYFLMVALIEELGYRFFAGSWLLSLTGRRWIAILLPAILYGMTHTGLEFLPPAEPFWGRAIAFTAIGCVWGWAFFRYGALTVVLSHFTADLFIFSWPRLGSGDPVLIAKAVATIAVPLIPAIAYFLFRRWRV